MLDISLALSSLGSQAPQQSRWERTYIWVVLSLPRKPHHLGEITTSVRGKWGFHIPGWKISWSSRIIHNFSCFLSLCWNRWKRITAQTTLFVGINHMRHLLLAISCMNQRPLPSRKHRRPKPISPPRSHFQSATTSSIEQLGFQRDIPTPTPTFWTIRCSQFIHLPERPLNKIKWQHPTRSVFSSTGPSWSISFALCFVSCWKLSLELFPAYADINQSTDINLCICGCSSWALLEEY